MFFHVSRTMSAIAGRAWLRTTGSEQEDGTYKTHLMKFMTWYDLRYGPLLAGATAVVHAVRLTVKVSTFWLSDAIDYQWMCLCLSPSMRATKKRQCGSDYAILGHLWSCQVMRSRSHTTSCHRLRVFALSLRNADQRRWKHSRRPWSVPTAH